MRHCRNETGQIRCLEQRRFAGEQVKVPSRACAHRPTPSIHKRFPLEWNRVDDRAKFTSPKRRTSSSRANTYPKTAKITKVSARFMLCPIFGQSNIHEPFVVLIDRSQNLLHCQKEIGQSVRATAAERFAIHSAETADRGQRFRSSECEQKSVTKCVESCRALGHGSRFAADTIELCVAIVSAAVHNIQ